jgi:hypothetical protein
MRRIRRGPAQILFTYRKHHHIPGQRYRLPAGWEFLYMESAVLKSKRWSVGQSVSRRYIPESPFSGSCAIDGSADLTVRGAAGTSAHTGFNPARAMFSERPNIRS